MEPTLPPGDVATRVTKDQAAAKTAESRQKFSSLMDQMEASKAQQGDYFFTFGKKTETDDNRVLILRKPSINRDTRQQTFVAVTRDGPMGASYQAGDSSTIQRKLEQLEQQGAIPSSVLGAYMRRISSGGALPFDLHGFLTPGEAETCLTDAMDKSIVAAEAPHKEAFETAQSNIRLADMLSQKLGQLPPKE